MIRLVCFLGNPGKEYRFTRHNVGWMLLDSAFPDLGFRGKFNADIAEVLPSRAQGGEKLRILRPTQYMNRSGESIGRAVAFFQLDIQEVCVVHDDLELPFGSIALKRGGGLGGHNGLRSVKAALGDPGFFRLRIGVGRPKHGKVDSFVLSRFSPDEEAVLPRILEAARQRLEEAVRASEPDSDNAAIKLF